MHYGDPLANTYLGVVGHLVGPSLDDFVILKEQDSSVTGLVGVVDLVGESLDVVLYPVSATVRTGEDPPIPVKSIPSINLLSSANPLV